MLFYFKYITHPVEKLHELVVFFFNKVEELNPSTFDRNVLLPSWYTGSKNRMLELEKKLTVFLTFSNEIKAKVIDAFKNANQIEAFFSDLSYCIPSCNDFELDTYRGVDNGGVEIDAKVSIFLKDLFNYLYEDQLGKKDSPFSKIISSNLSEHFRRFKSEAQYEDTNFGICPICGLETIRDAENIGRPPYDHLLPKSIFVFSAVNLKNLLPIGDDCNYKKGMHSLLHSDENYTIRSLSFYPYSSTNQSFNEFRFQLQCIRFPNKSDNGEWTVTIDPATTVEDEAEKIETWDRIFKIKNRLVEYICTHHKSLVDQEFKISRISTTEELRTKLLEQLSRLPYSYYFLATKIDLVPMRMFYKWALDNPNYLEGLMPKVVVNVVDIDF